MDVYVAQLCNEKHEADRQRIAACEDGERRAHERVDEVIAAVNGKFTKLFYFFLATLVSSVGGTLTIILMLLTRWSK